MPRTTLDIDSPILQELKVLQKHRSLGQLVSQLLAEALAQRKNHKESSSWHWVSRPMQARIDLDDKDALYAILDKDPIKIHRELFPGRQCSAVRLGPSESPLSSREPFSC